jgi:hypothetical protein
MPHRQLQLLILCHLIDERLRSLTDAGLGIAIVTRPCWVDQ